MYQSVRDYFNTFQSKYEGYLSFMYLDVKGLVTTGMGNLIDPIDTALGLPWVHKSDGSPASQDEIVAEWNTVKNRTDLASHGGGSFSSVTSLKLNDDSIQNLIVSRAESDEAYLKDRFSDWDSWPADAQLGVLSMAWAMGPGFHFPKFEAAAIAQDWETAAKESHIDTTGNPGVIPRNADNLTLFENAAAVAQSKADPSILYFPKVVTSETLSKGGTRWPIIGGALIVVASLATYYFGRKS